MLELRRSIWNQRMMNTGELSFALTFVVSLLVVRTTQSPIASMCVTPDTIRASARILDTMDATIDPCDDFFEYACGRWNRVNVIPDDKSTYNTFRKLIEELHVSLKTIFERLDTTNDTLSYRKVKYLYKSCMNIPLIETRPDKPLETLLGTFGGWPVLDEEWENDRKIISENSTTFDLEQKSKVGNENSSTIDSEQKSKMENKKRDTLDLEQKFKMENKNTSNFDQEQKSNMVNENSSTFDLERKSTLENKTDNTFDLEQLLARLRLFNLGVFINSWVVVDEEHSDVNIIQLDQAQLGLPNREYFLRGRMDKTLQSYQDLAINVAIELGANKTRAKEEMTEMVDFEIALANITLPENGRQTFNRYNISRLYTLIAKNFDWLKYLNYVFENVGIQLNDSEIVAVYASTYMIELGKLLEATPKKIIKNYLIWRLVMSRLDSLPQKFNDLRRPLNKWLHGTSQDPSRWRECTRYVSDNLGMAVGRLFVKEHFDEEAKTNVIYIIRNIRDAFKKLLNEVTWMDEETKELAREKVDAIQELIGYPDYIMDDALLDADYEELNIDPDKYFENCEANLIETSKKMLKTLRQPVNKTRWTTNVAMVNAFYSATKNMMMFPAGILQPPFYHKNYPMSMNFGGIAMVIGHELIHGFDNRGRQYDKSGNMKQWWANSSIEGFNQRVQCVIDQYSNFTVEEINMNINGEQTQGENIADNVGLKVAFAAYNTWVERTNRRDEPLLPGLSLNHQQLFFLNFAQIWCGTVRPEAYFQSIISGRHCPGRYRVKGVLSNSVDFAKAFNCPPGSRMNPPNKCTVW